MGQAPLTGTVCPFPYTNTSATPLCSQLCSEVLGSKYEGLRVTLLVAASCSLVLYASRMFYIGRKLKLQKNGNKQFALRKSLEFWFFIGIFFVTFLVTAIDFRGLGGIIDPQAYVILNEISGASLLTAGLILVDFWVACASPLLSTGVRFKKPFIALIYATFVLLVILGLYADPMNFNIFDGVKGLTVASLVVFWQIQAWRAFTEIKRVLMASNVHRHAPNSSSDPSKSSDAPGDSQGKRMVKVLNQKFAAFYIFSTLGVILYLVSGITSFLSKDPTFGYQWKVTCDISTNSMFAKVVQILGCIVSFSFFALPKNARQAVADSSLDKQARSPRHLANRADDVPAANITATEPTSS